MVQLPSAAGAQREQAAVLARHFLQVLQHHAGLDRDGVVERIDLRTRLSRCSEITTTGRSPAAAGVAPPHRPVLPPWGHHGRGCAWRGITTVATSSALRAQHGERLASVAPAPVGQVGRRVVGSGQHMLRPDGGAAQVEEGVGAEGVDMVSAGSRDGPGVMAARWRGHVV